MHCYNCGRPLPMEVIECPACGQMIYTTFDMPMASKGRRIDGCLPSAPSPQDYRATPNLSTVPRKVDLRPDCTSVEDQAKIGSCIACSIVGAMEYRQKQEGKPALDLSRMFVYFNARRLRGSSDRDSGATIADGLAALLAFGAPPESVWPYNPDLLAKTPDDAAYRQAVGNQPGEYARVDGTDGIRGALARQYPVVFSCFIPQRCYDEARATGRVPAATSAELDVMRSLHGNHAMLVVGYDLDEGSYLVRNSWGQDWGNKGYCTIPFPVFESVLAQGSTWILGKLEEAGAFTVHRPARAAASTPVEGGVRDLAAKMRDEIRSSLTKDIQDSFKDIKDRLKPR